MAPLPSFTLTYNTSQTAPFTLGSFTFSFQSSSGSNYTYYCSNYTQNTSIDFGINNNNDLISANIPSTIINMNYFVGGYGVFTASNALTTVTFDQNSNLQNIGQECFYNCGAFTSISIPSTVTSIGQSAFADVALTSITIPPYAQLGIQCFVGNQNLTSLIIPSTVTFVPQSDSPFKDIPAYCNFPPTTYSPIVPQSQAATLYTSPLDNSNPVYANFQSFYNETNPSGYFAQINYSLYPIPMVCFKEDSKILTKQGYRPIQDLRKGDLIKTIANGYVPIDMIGYREIHNPNCEERIKDKLYVCTYKEYPEIFEDLVITGCHAILVDNYKDKQQEEKSVEVLGGLYITDDKYRLPACVDDRAKPYEKEGKFTIYHIALENDEYYFNYGIYANGLVVETCSKRYLKELSNMTLLNL